VSNINILALETATALCSVALRVGAHTYALDEGQPFKHGETILTQVNNILETGGIGLSDLNAIAFGRGPGSFTGLRIAAAVTQGLALGANIPVIPISSLQILAQEAYQTHRATQVIAAIDARMGEIYWGCYACIDGVMQLCGQEQVGMPDELVLPDNIALQAWRGAGSGWREYGDKIIASLPAVMADLPVYPELWPRAVAMLDIAELRYAQQQFVTAEHAIPVYLRDDVVR